MMCSGTFAGTSSPEPPDPIARALIATSGRSVLRAGRCPVPAAEGARVWKAPLDAGFAGLRELDQAADPRIFVGERDGVPRGDSEPSIARAASFAEPARR